MDIGRFHISKGWAIAGGLVIGLALIIAIAGSGGSEPQQQEQAPAPTTATPEPTAAPTIDLCPTEAEQRYFDALAEQLLVIVDASFSTSDLLHEAAEDLSLFFDEAWQLSAAVQFATMGIAADTILALAAPSSVSHIQELANEAAEHLNAGNAHAISGIDNIDEDALIRAAESWQKATAAMDDMSEQISAHCQEKVTAPPAPTPAPSPTPKAVDTRIFFVEGQGWDARYIELDEGIHIVELVLTGNERCFSTGECFGDNFSVIMESVDSGALTIVMSGTAGDWSGSAEVRVGHEEDDDLPPGNQLLEIDASGVWTVQVISDVR